MYLHHFGLHQLPFDLTPDTLFFWPYSCHQEILQSIITSLKQENTGIKVTGVKGSGKTLLSQKLHETISDQYLTAYISNSNLSIKECCLLLAQQIGIDANSLNLIEINQLIEHVLVKIDSENKTLVLIIDDADTLADSIWEMLSLLLNSKNNPNCIQLVLFAHPRLDEKLTQPLMSQMKQRITHSFELALLSEQQIQPYLHHRLTLSGYQGAAVFSDHVCKILYLASHGEFKLLNHLADICLQLAFSEGSKKINLDKVSQAIKKTNATYPAELTEWMNHTKHNHKLLSKMWFLAGIAITSTLVLLILSIS